MSIKEWLHWLKGKTIGLSPMRLTAKPIGEKISIDYSKDVTFVGPHILRPGEWVEFTLSTGEKRRIEGPKVERDDMEA